MAKLRSLGGLLCLLQFLIWSLSANAYSKLTDESLKALAGPGDDFNIHTGSLLAPILIPRVSGTAGSTKVLNHLVDFFKTTLPKWDITFQNSTSKTPATGDKDVPFINLILTRKPPWATVGEVSYLTLAAHYDSKYTPKGFIGATDSAAPCAMLMHAARAVDAALTKKWDSMQGQAMEPGGFGSEDQYQGVQILFLDGEESFISWTRTDSLYGARSLAEEWESTPHPALSTYRNPLSSISLFVLLDLLGAKGPVVPSYFKVTHWAYKHMATLETRLRDLNLFKSSPNHHSKRSSPSKSKPNKRDREPLFLTDANKNIERWMGGMIEDDHVPFLARGVEVLHIITSPFPRVWHELDDNGANLDMDTVEDWTKLVIAFVGEWMELEGHFGTSREKRAPREELR